MQNGVWSAFPYIVLSVSIVFSGMLCDKIIAWGRLKKVVVRKIFTGLGKTSFCQKFLSLL